MEIGVHRAKKKKSWRGFTLYVFVCEITLQ